MSSIIMFPVVLIVFLFGTVHAGIHMGCYKEILRKRHFNINPGDYSPEMVSVKSCMAACGTFDYAYAATSSGKFCYCSNSLPDASAKEADSNCDMPCAGDGSYMCGGAGHASVYQSSVKVEGLDITSDAVNEIIPVGNEVNLDVSIESGRDVVFRFDYEDGAGKSSPNATNMFLRTYYIPGDYSIHVYANNMNETFEDVVAATSVRVASPSGLVGIECDPVFATHEKGYCVVTAWEGTNLELDISVASFTTNVLVEDPILSLAGPGVPSKAVDAGSDSANIYLMYASQFSVSGRIVGWEFYATVVGSQTLTMLVLKPICSGQTYCYTSNECAASCDSENLLVTSCLANPMCVQYASCDTTAPCSPVVARLNSIPSDFEVKHVVTLTVTTTGYQYIPENREFLVEPGDLLGLDHQVGDVVLGRIQALPPDDDNTFTSGSSAIGTAFAKSSGTSASIRHAIRAVGSGGSKVNMPYTFNEAGNFTMTATAVSTILAGTPANTTTTNVMVLEGVNASIIDGPDYGKSGEAITFTLMPHTGNAVFYNWTFDSTTFFGTQDISKSFTFPARGTYLVNVTAYNSISFKNNQTWIQIEDELLGLTLSANPTAVGSPSQISFSLTKGSDYSCTWDYGDSSPNDVTDDVSTPQAGATQSHTYVIKGTYTIQVDCKNNVSDINQTLTHKVQEIITNLRMTREGANKNTDFILEWEVDKGNEITFDLTFGGNKITVLTPVSDYSWKSDLQSGRTPVTIPIILNASNLVSNASIEVDFVVLSVIIDPTFTTTVTNETSHTDITYTASMTSGSHVTVTIDWDDGTTDEYKQMPQANEWPGPIDFVHQYLNGGIFEAKATFTNKEGSYIKTATVTVMVGVGIIKCVMEDYTLYHPPAYVNLTLESTTLPTDPTLSLHWGEKQGTSTTPALVLNEPYRHKYGDTGEYIVNATISNILGTKTCEMKLIVVEKLVTPSFQLKFPKAAVNMPFEITFCLNRGPNKELCNLTIDYGDGTNEVFDRQGEGQDGCDTKEVTYTDKVAKTIKVTARSPLETVDDTITITIIDGINSASLTATPVLDVDLGTPSVFAVSYAGATPTSPKIKFIYGDNGITEENDGALSTPSHSQNHQYTKDGLYNATIIAYNDATQVEVNLTVGVYTTFTNLQAKAYYLKTHPPGEIEYGGYGGNTDIYPQNEPVWFEVTSDNNAYAERYEVTIKDKSNVATSEIFYTALFSLTFPKTDDYTVTIKAVNPKHDATTTPVIVKLLELVKDFEIIEGTKKVRANEEKVFNVSFGAVGTDTCLYVDYGNSRKSIYSENLPGCTKAEFSGVPASAKHALVGLTTLKNVYTTDGYYELVAQAINAQSDETQRIGFSITGLDCAKPSVSIHDRKNYFTQPQVFKRSDRIQIRGLSNIECAQSYENTKSWFIEKMDPDYDTVINTVTLDGIETKTAELNLPSRFLPLGLYRVHYEMTMTGDYGSSAFSSTTFTYIKVEATELIGVMVSGGVSEILRGQAQTLDLKPIDYSKDPDVDPNVNQGLKVLSWTCHKKGSSPGVDAECQSAGFLYAERDTQSLQISSLTADATYQISADVAKIGNEARKATTEIFLVVVVGTPPIVTIQPIEGSVFFQQSDGYRILQSSRFSMECLCEGCADPNTLSYQWNIYLYDYRWDEGLRPLEEADTDNRVLGRQSKQISMEPSLFETFPAPSLKVQCQITKPDGTQGKVATKLTINDTPKGGSCSVTPQNITYTPEKSWTISVNDWMDPDGLNKYQFYTHLSDDEVDRQITSVDILTPEINLLVSLSEGYDFMAYMQEIILQVSDKLGGVTRHSCGQVEVRPMALNNVNSLMNNILGNELNDLNKLFAEGDQKACTEKITSIFSTMNSASKRSRTVYAGYRMASNYDGSMYGQNDAGRPSYQKTSDLLKDDEEGHFEMEEQRNARAETRLKIVDSLTKLPAESMTSVLQLGNALNQATRYGDEITKNTQELIVDYAENITNFMLDKDNLVGVTPEEIEAGMSNVAAVVGNLMSSSGGNGFFGTLAELEETKEDETFSEYDASFDNGIDYEMEAASDFQAALEIHKARIHKKRQEEVAQRVRKKTMRIMDKFAEIYSTYSVPGQVLEMNTLKMKVTLEKTEVQDLDGKTLRIKNSIGGATMPNITFLSGVEKDSPVVLSVSQSTSHPLMYSKAAEAISSTTNFIHVNIYDDNNKKFTVSNMAEPARLIIPRDSNAEAPAYLDTNPMITSWTNLMIFTTQVNRTSSSFFMDFDDIKNRQFLMVIKKGKAPKIRENSTEDECDLVYLMPESMDKHKDDDDKDKYRFFLGDETLGDFIGTIYVGIRELNSTEYDMDISQSCYSLPRYDNGTDYFKGNFKMRQYVSQCLAISDTQDDWTTNGCHVGRETDDKKTVCYCNHLTTFAGGWVVVPNTIDWSYVFANADFLSNPTIYVTQIVIVVLFICAIIYARLQDKKMAEKLGLAPLPDNDPKDKYIYEIMVSTGMRRNAGTNSQVCFILSGEDDETDIRAFSDNKRKIFMRGQVDGFLMTVSRPLGYLNFMRIWHDNSGKGKFGSWYLNYIMVRDVQTDDKQVFICNKWLAVEEEDGQVDRVLPVAGREQLADFSYQFGERTRKNLADGHLWFSVVARPPQSRFTCVQRTSCILCLLYVTMLANAMFYNTSPQDEQTNNAFNFGPFSVSPEQIFIGVISNLIVFPVNFLLVFLFRKTRPHHKRPSRIDRAIQEVNEQASKHTSPNDVKPEVSSIFSVSKSPTLPSDPHRPDSATSRPATGVSRDMPKKKKKFELPWYFVIFAWVLLVIVTLGAAFLTTFYGITFKDEKCKKWISSMLVSFFMSVFITQPIKVFLFAIILSIIVKNPSEEKEDEDDDEEIHQTNMAEHDYLHDDGDGFGATRPRKIGYKPPDPALLEKYRQKRLKEIKMWAIVREVIIYVFFLWILLVISYRQLGPANFLFKNTMHRVFIENNDTKINFNTLSNTEDFWDWAKTGLVNGIRAGSYYNDYPPLKLRSYVNDKVSRILGYAVMRQLRIKPALCEIPDEMVTVISQCNIGYQILDQQEEAFMPGWRPFAANETLNDTRPEYRYSKANSLNGYPYWGTLAWYSGGGYVLPMKTGKQGLIEKLEQLQAEGWIDRFTRAVFVEFTVYNPQVNLFAINTILTEFHPDGGTVQSFRFEPAMLLPYMDSAMLFQLIIQGIFVLFTLFFIIRELRELIKLRFSYFKSFWNLVEIGIIAMSVTAIVLYFYRLFVTLDLTKTFKASEGNGYVKFQYVGYWNEMLSYMVGFLVFMASLKFLKLLRFNKKITLLSATLHHSARSLLHFSIIYAIVFLAFAQLFYLTYMNIDIAYSTFIDSVVASVLMMMGKFNIYTMIMKEPILTQVFVLLFVVTVTFIMVNMFISILNETFTVVREDINKQGNDYEIVDFMVNTFRKWTGIGGVPADHDIDPDEWKNRKNRTSGRRPGAEPDSVDDFPDRIDRLLQSISAVYTDNDNFARMYNKKPFQSGARDDPKSLLRQGRSPSPGPGFRKDSSGAVARVHTH